MDIEQLSKSQIVLLTLLITFVTSIATGIVTVALMEKAPPSVAQTVNRIVERTVERVVPAGQTAATIVTREKTVVVKESDLIPQAVENASLSAVRLYVSNSDPPAFLGIGLVIDFSGAIATDIDAVYGIAELVAVLPDGSRLRSDVIARDRNSGIALLQAATTTMDGKKPALKPATISVGNPRLGQSVIAIASESRNRIADGIITALQPQSAESGVSGDVIETNIPGESIMPGGFLVNSDGEIIGISTSISRLSSARSFMQSSALIKESTNKKDSQ